MDNKVKAAIIGAIIAGVFGLFSDFLPNEAIQEAIQGKLHLVDEPPEIFDLMPTPHTPQADGTNITWTAVANDPEGDPILYKFQLSGPSTGGIYVDQQNWSTNSEWIWKSDYSDIGTNYIRVWVKDEKNEVKSTPITYNITNSGPGEIIHSDYKKMYVSVTYPFMACVALNDSIDNAQRQIANFTDAVDKSLITSNDSIDAAKREFETSPEIVRTSMNVSEEVSVDLKDSPSGTFSIKFISPGTKNQKIPQDDPPHNYAKWIWDVTPIREGTHKLILNVNDTKNRNRGVYIPITVESVEEPAPAVEEPVAEEPAEEPAEEEAGGIPGFEAIYAITGLLAVAYLKLGRRK